LGIKHPPKTLVSSGEIIGSDEYSVSSGILKKNIDRHIALGSPVRALALFRAFLFWFGLSFADDGERMTDSGF